VASGGTSRDLLLRVFEILSSSKLVFEMSTAMESSRIGVHVGDWGGSPGILTWSFFPKTSTSSRNSKGRSSSTGDELADEWDNCVLPLLLVVTDDVDWCVECVRGGVGTEFVEFGGGEP